MAEKHLGKRLGTLSAGPPLAEGHQAVGHLPLSTGLSSLVSSLYLPLGTLLTASTGLWSLVSGLWSSFPPYKCAPRPKNRRQSTPGPQYLSS